MKHRERRSDSLTAKTEAAQSQNQVFSIPRNHKQLKGIDGQRWKSLCLSRKDWTEAELLMLYEIVTNWAEVDDALAQAEGEPLMIQKINGDKVANPIWSEIRQRRKELRDAIRQAGLQVTQERANSGNATGKKVKGEGGADSLPKVSNVRALIG